MTCAIPTAETATQRVPPMDSYSDVTGFIDLGSEDIDRLEGLAPFVEQRRDALVARFARTIGGQPTNGAEPAADLSEAVGDWFDGLFGPHNPNRSRLRRRALQAEIPAEQLFGALHELRLDLHQLVRRADLCQPVDPTCDSIDRLIDLESALFTKAYLSEMADQKRDSAATLVAGLSHEIYNPLNSIMLHMSLLERQAGPDDEVDQIIEAVRSEVRRIGQFTGKLTDFSRPLHIEPQWVDLAELFETIAEEHGERLERADIELTTTLRGPTRLFVDEARLKEAIVNLVHNAVEAIEGAGQIDLSVDSSEEATAIEVRDTGPGIDSADHARIFDLFYTTKASATGLGLPLVKKIVDAHLGSVDVLNPSDGGTAIRLRLPRRPLGPRDSTVELR